MQDKYTHYIFCNYTDVIIQLIYYFKMFIYFSDSLIIDII